MRLIDAQPVRKKMLKELDEMLSNGKDISTAVYLQALEKMIIHCIDDAPTVDANPIINAQWELVRYDPDYLVYSGTCTACKQKHESTDNVGKLPFCPHCGAQMTGEKMPVLIISGEEEQ